MGIIELIILFLGIGLLFIVLFQLLILFLIYKLIKNYPRLALFLLIILITIGITGSLNPITFTPSVVILTSSLITLFWQYKRLKKGLKILKK